MDYVFDCMDCEEETTVYDWDGVRRIQHRCNQCIFQRCADCLTGGQESCLTHQDWETTIHLP